MSLLIELQELDEDYDYFDMIGANLFPMQNLLDPTNELGWNLTGKDEMRAIGWRPDGSGLYLWIGGSEKISNPVLNNQVPVVILWSDGDREVLCSNLVELLRMIEKDGDYNDGADYESALKYSSVDDKPFLIEAHTAIKKGVTKILSEHIPLK